MKQFILLRDKASQIAYGTPFSDPDDSFNSTQDASVAFSIDIPNGATNVLVSVQPGAALLVSLIGAISAPPASPTSGAGVKQLQGKEYLSVVKDGKSVPTLYCYPLQTANYGFEFFTTKNE